MYPMQCARLQKNIKSDIYTECKKIIASKRVLMAFKRLSDIVLSLVLTVLLSPVMLVCAVAVASGRDGPVFFRQTRVGKDGRLFKIIKFRTMKPSEGGSQVTVGNDMRVTKAGRFLRKTRLDEFPQLFNILKGDMSLVGPRPEVEHYVDAYTDDWLATLLVRPGITCRSSIEFADEAELLSGCDDVDSAYIERILPKKCGMNIDYVKNLSLLEDIRIMLATVKAVIK